MTLDQLKFYNIHGSDGTNHGGISISGATGTRPEEDT